MAGDHNLLKVDPAIERWALMRENTYKHFTWSPRNTLGLTWLAFKTDVRSSISVNVWNFAGAQTKEDLKRKR
ncbi:hypothetical protein BC938DRAFT_478124 [Jimgerdemannia flammicorona]|uniref:Uncharacterized protein n=1 Tax=Jimgerdemannia flammicorona TaxID=994334 RepID=A0A433QYM1_9FUNG|nr:hypothetical protein BC938DRAFT_478124 [Jimgerdemannia flammicorona]